MTKQNGRTPTVPWDIVPTVLPKAKAKLTTPLIYYGGKTLLADLVIAQFPPHETYVEVFGGGAAVLIQKKKSPVEVYNDIGNVAHFFRVLREHGRELYHALYLTPYSRAEFYACYRGWQASLDRATSSNRPEDWIEWARQWYVLIVQGFTHEESGDSWRLSKQGDAAGSVRNHVDDLPQVTHRLREVHIEHLDFRKVIDYYDASNTLFYCDPPYIAESRTETGNYLNEMLRADHEDLLRRLIDAKGQVVISGYDNDLYRDRLSGWRRVEQTRKSQIHNAMQHDLGLVGERTEVIWVKEYKRGLWQ